MHKYGLPFQGQIRDGRANTYCQAPLTLAILAQRGFSGAMTIFVNYRREDSQSITGRIDDVLRAAFGDNDVYRDIDSIPPGADFADHLLEALGRCDVCVAVFGATWVSPRLNDKADFVRREIEEAIRRGIPIIPVLVEGASLPTDGQVPDSLHPVLRRQALTVDSGRDFQSHVQKLVNAIRRARSDRTHPPSVAQAAVNRQGATSEPSHVEISGPSTVWHATKQSIEARAPSYLGLLETGLAVLAHGWTAYHGSVYQLVFGVVLAPILLLRTPASEALALKWWFRTYGQRSYWAMLMVVLASSPFVLLLSGPSLNEKLVLTFLWTCGPALAIPTMVVRAGATLLQLRRDPKTCLRAIHSNLWLIACCTDMTRPPELLPGASGEHARAVLSDARDDKRATAVLLPWTSAKHIRAKHPFPLCLLSLAPVAVLTVISTAYRLSLKGTSLLWLPMAWSSHDAPGTKPEHLSKAIVRGWIYMWSWAVVFFFFIVWLLHLFFGSVSTPLAHLVETHLSSSWWLLATGAEGHPVLARLFAADAFRLWHAFLLLGAITAIGTRVYAGRLELRAYDARQKWRFELGVMLSAALFVASYVFLLLAVLPA